MTPLALDHVAFGVRNVGAIAESFGRIGFTATAPSRCAWDQGDGPMTSSSVSVMFAEQYLDFVEIDHPRWLEHLERSPLYGGRAAPSGIVLRGFTKEEIRARGASYTITRTLEGASPSQVRYEFLSAPDSGLPLGLIFDAAPAAMRTPEWLTHPNTASAIRRLHLWAPANRRVADWIDLEAVGIERTALIQDDYLSRVAALAPQMGRPSLLSIQIEVADLAAARAVLAGSGVGFDEDAGKLRIDPQEGLGLGVQLVAAE